MWISDQIYGHYTSYEREQRTIEISTQFLYFIPEASQYVDMFRQNFGGYRRDAVNMVSRLASLTMARGFLENIETVFFQDLENFTKGF